MQTNVRLIDANALIEEMKDLMDNENEDDEWNKPLKFALKLIDSAPTVETTDDVMARLPLGVKVFKYDNGDGTFRIKATAHDCEKKYLNPWAYGETAIEAVLRLEASLNTK